MNPGILLGDSILLELCFFLEYGVIAPKTVGGVFQISMEKALGSRPFPSGHLYNIPLLIFQPALPQSPHQY